MNRERVRKIQIICVLGETLSFHLLLFLGTFKLIPNCFLGLVNNILQHFFTWTFQIEVKHTKIKFPQTCCIYC